MLSPAAERLRWARGSARAAGDGPGGWRRAGRARGVRGQFRSRRHDPRRWHHPERADLPDPGRRRAGRQRSGDPRGCRVRPRQADQGPVSEWHLAGAPRSEGAGRADRIGLAGPLSGGVAARVRAPAEAELYGLNDHLVRDAIRVLLLADRAYGRPGVSPERCACGRVPRRPDAGAAAGLGAALRPAPGADLGAVSSSRRRSPPGRAAARSRRCSSCIWRSAIRATSRLPGRRSPGSSGCASRTVSGPGSTSWKPTGRST